MLFQWPVLRKEKKIKMRPASGHLVWYFISKVDPKDASKGVEVVLTQYKDRWELAKIIIKKAEGAESLLLLLYQNGML